MRLVGGFIWILRFPTPIKLTATITEILLNAELNTMNQTIRRLQKMEQNFNKGVDSEDSRFDHEKYTVYSWA